MPTRVRWVLVIFAVSLSIRLALLCVVSPHPQRIFTPDSGGYERLAVNLLAGHGFSTSAEAPFLPDSVRTPVYPVFVAAVYAACGAKPLWVAVAQAALSALTCVLTYGLGQELLADRQALLGGLLLAGSLGSVVYSLYLLTETLFTLLLLGILYLVVLYNRRRRACLLVAASVLLGLATLCRPVSLYFPVMVAAMVLGVHRSDFRKGILAAVAVGIIFVATITPWLARNYVVFGRLCLSSISAYNLLFYNAVSLEADLRGLGQTQVREEMGQEVAAYLASLGLDDVSTIRKAAIYQRLAWEKIGQHPLRYAFVHVRSDANMFLPNVTELLELFGLTSSGRGTLSVLNHRGLMAAVSHYFEGKEYLVLVILPFTGLLLGIYGAAVVGVGRLARERQWFALALLLSVIAYFALIPGAPAHPRFRVPFMPYLSLLAAVGVGVAWDALSAGSLQMLMIFRERKQAG